jgi:hypothetical protein
MPPSPLGSPVASDPTLHPETLDVIQAEDGTETPIGAGDGYVIEPGHDAWVAGDEPYVGVDFAEEMAEYAKPK